MFRQRTLAVAMALPLLIAWLAWRWLSFVPATPTAYFAARAADAPPLIIAHRGGDGLLPGNTIAAFAHARDLGADVLHVEVRSTKDNVLVAYHAGALQSSTDGTGEVEALGAAQLHALDAGYRWPGGDARTIYRGQGLGIPNLSELLQGFPDTRWNIELASDDAALAQGVCSLLRATRSGAQVLVVSDGMVAMEAFRAACPEVATAASKSEVRRFVWLHMLGLEVLFRTRALALQVPRRDEGIGVLDAEFVRAARARGLQVDARAINTREELRAVMRLGVAGIVTDRPDLALAVRAPRAPRA